MTHFELAHNVPNNINSNNDNNKVGGGRTQSSKIKKNNELFIIQWISNFTLLQLHHVSSLDFDDYGLQI